MWKLYISGWILVLEFSLGDHNAENTSHPCPVGKSWSATLNHIKGQRNFCLSCLPATLQEKRRKETRMKGHKDKGVASNRLSVFFMSTTPTHNRLK